MTGMLDDPAHDHVPPPRLNPLSRFMLWVAGVDARILTTQCPEDIPKVLAQTGLLLATCLYSCAVLSMIFHRLFMAEHLSLVLILGAIGVSVLVSAADGYFLLHCSWIKDGTGQLQAQGWNIPVSRAQTAKTTLFLLNRLLLSMAWAYIIGLCLSLQIYSADTHLRMERAYLKANAAIIAQVSRPYDDEIKSERDAVINQELVVKALSKQAIVLRQSQATSIARGGKKRRDDVALGNGAQSFEARTNEETAKLDNMKKHLAALVEARNGKVRKGVDSTPGHIPYGGFLAEVSALEEIKAESGTIATIVDAIEVIAVGIEMAAVLGKLLGWNPTLYSVVVARAFYTRLEEIADEMEREIAPASRTTSNSAPDLPTNDNDPFAGLEIPANDNAASGQVVKRGRGRPRGSKTRNRFTNGSGQEVPKGQQDPEA